MLSTTEKMRLTIRHAREAMDNGECPIGAIVFLGDVIVSKSYTKEAAERRLLVHAELNALLEADIKRYSYEERLKMQLFTNLEPCMMCMGAAMSFFIGEVYYALESPMDGATGIARKWNPQSEDFKSYRVPGIYSGILREESRELFREYAAACKSGGLKEFAQALANL